MASMVAISCITSSQLSSPMVIQENGSRNKRKFRADPPIVDLDTVITELQGETTSYELSSEKFDIVHSHVHPNCCDMCGVKQEITECLKLDLEDIEVNWNDYTESELEELVLNNLETIFKSAIKKIVACGYNEEIATKAVLRSGLCYGRCKDMVSNIVDNTLSFLSSGQEIDTLREPYLEDLHQMGKYILTEMVCVLKEVGPSLSNGDAMWCLLICDMNIAHACTMETDMIESKTMEPKLLKPSKPISSPIPNNFIQSKALTSVGCSKSRPFGVPNGAFSSEKEGANSNTPNTVEKFVSSRKLSGITKRDYVLRKNSLHKGGSRPGKLKPIADSSGVNTMNGLKLRKAVGVEVSQDKLNQNKATNVGFPLVPVFNSSPKSTSLVHNNTNSLPVRATADTDLSLSSPAKSSYKKDEVIVKLVPRVQELENQLKEWTEWANQKVMEAARRLGKDKAELKALKQEKEETEQLKKEKQVLAENTLKKLSEMENAIRKASGQVERASVTVRRLDVENTIIEREMQASKLRAAESGARFQEALRREKNTLIKCRSWEKQKALFQEELVAEKSVVLQLQNKLEQAEDVRNQLEARQKQEKQCKEEIFAQAISLEKEKEKIENSTKSKEDAMKLAVENNFYKYKDEIKNLEKEISQLRLKSDSSKIAALRDSSNIPIFNDIQIRCINKDASKFGVKRERECVMCLSEEMSVVFLPCAHQVVCTMCNELHEKQGMKDCPSCRSTIQQRVTVRYATK